MKLTRVEKLLILLDFAKEFTQEFCKKIFANKALKASCYVLFVFFILAIPLFTIFSFQPNAQSSLPACSSLASNVTPDPGNNCLFFEGRPLCRDVANPDHRTNCADLIDLPLCSDIVVSGGNGAHPGRNCVDLCSASSYNDPDPTANPSLVRGIDYAVFNKDCTRFCDDVESGITPNRNVNCVARKCHQLSPGVDPISSGSGLNCEILACNLLTPDELNKTKFDDATKKYCEGSNLKCYNFAQSQLPYVRMRAMNPICNVHDCTPSSPVCGQPDLLNITNQGPAYTAVYERYINGGFSIATNGICRVVLCREIIKPQYRCVNSAGVMTGLSSDDNFRNPSCDSSGAGSVCASNYCYETIDCNAVANQSRTECQQAANVPSGHGDPFNSWFYRPKPLNKAIDTSTGILHPMNPALCMHRDQMDPRTGGVGPGEHNVTNMGLFTIDWGYYSDYLRFPTSSPGACNSVPGGNRGIGYGYICGDGGLVTNRTSVVRQAVDYGSAYFKGYAVTDFSGTYPKHKVTVCLRFKNTMTLNACGERECGISAIFGNITLNTCGGDVCKDLIIDEANEKECSMNGGGDNGSFCANTIDTYQRLRAVKYNDKICAFFDSKGQVAYADNAAFFDGRETLNDGKTCVNDNSSVNSCNGYNSNSNPSSASVWRTSLKVHYVDNNRPGNPPAEQRGYLDINGRLYKEQECPKVTLRIPPPDLYNLGIVSNSEKLFVPPLGIRAATVIRGGSDAIPSSGDLYGITDFHYPEMKIQFGVNVYKMSLGLGYQGNDSSGENYAASPAVQNISTSFNGRDYLAELYVTKEYDANSKWPLFCLYRKFRDQNGLYLPAIKVGCIKRNRPDLDNAVLRNFDATLPVRKTIVNSVVGNQYNNSQISVKYLAGFGANNINNNCGSDDICTTAITLDNLDYKTPTCKRDVENYEICAKREECSRLNIECVQNEIDYRNAEIAGQDTTIFQAIRNSCNEVTLPFCNNKKGVNLSSGSTIYNSNPNAVIADPLYYGWFNEICVVSGFENKLTNVVAKVTGNSFMGKCLISAVSPYLTDNNPATNCDAGGFAPNCLCVEAPDGYLTNTGEVVRKKTPREAGLCTDMPLPQFCLAINHNQNPNSDTTDIDYVRSSVGKMSYGGSGVNVSHQYRSFGKVAPNEILTAGHAEFAKALIGVPDVRGECRGFWTYDANSSGVLLLPTMSCLNNNGEAVWEASTRNPCVRYSCQEAKTYGPALDGVYQGSYGVNESGENKGLSNGFATWNKFTKTNDFLENANAIACISGFKPAGSSALISQGVITGYSGGTLPTRSCDQLGNWMATSNNCQRIQCQAINPRIPTSSSDSAAWNAWYASGGATFPAVNASRSAVRTQTESIAVGTCNNNLGFFQSPGGLPPTVECDSLGNWLVVKNPCVTSCSAISSDSEASSLNNGFSKWATGIGAAGASEVSGVFTGCVVGYVTNPYPPTKDASGNSLAPSIANDLTRPAELPKRMCTFGASANGVSASVWANVVNGCINQCPGASVDSRIGVGVTSHSTSAGAVNIEWPSTELNQYAYVTNWNGLETLFDASYFAQGRANGYYLLRRYCNANGKWENAEPMCSANNGLIGNANYSASSTGYKNSIKAGDPTDVVTGACTVNYWKYNTDQGALPQRQCVYSSGNQYIDKTYLALSSATHDCEMIVCPPYSYVGARVSFNIPASASRTINSQFQGSCTNQDDTTGTVTSASVGTGLVPPTVTCQANGTWSAVQNESNCKYNCTVENSIAQPVNPNKYVLKHNYYLRTHKAEHWNEECFTATYGYNCNDGVLGIINYNHDSRSGPDFYCRVEQYNPIANGWCSTIFYGSVPAISTGPILTGMGCQ